MTMIDKDNSIAWTASTYLLVNDQLKEALNSGYVISNIEPTEYGFTLHLTKVFDR